MANCENCRRWNAKFLDDELGLVFCDKRCQIAYVETIGQSAEAVPSAAARPATPDRRAGAAPHSATPGSAKSGARSAPAAAAAAAARATAAQARLDGIRAAKQAAADALAAQEAAEAAAEEEAEAAAAAQEAAEVAAAEEAAAAEAAVSAVVAASHTSGDADAADLAAAPGSAARADGALASGRKRKRGEGFQHLPPQDADAAREQMLVVQGSTQARLQALDGMPHADDPVAFAAFWAGVKKAVMDRRKALPPGGTRRPRVPWREIEDQLLVEGLDAYAAGDFEAVQLRFWNFVDDDGVECAGFSEAKRHPTDLKDRWKVICKQLAEGRLPAHLVDFAERIRDLQEEDAERPKRATASHRAKVQREASMLEEGADGDVGFAAAEEDGAGAAAAGAGGAAAVSAFEGLNTSGGSARRSASRGRPSAGAPGAAAAASPAGRAVAPPAKRGRPATAASR